MRAVRAQPDRRSALSDDLEPRFLSAPVEARWQAFWDAQGYARPSASHSAPPYTIVLPPPNVTGILTIGHMLGGTVMDTLIRRRRMQGKASLWVPGLDHAGVATQVEVRRRLSKQGIRMEALSREEILGHVEAWREEHEAYILRQLKAPGFSLDWSRYRYTMDPGATRATREVFVRLFEERLIYRGERMVNWDPILRTALSDLEVLHRDETTDLVYLQYPWEDGSPGGVTVATVRPETIFGDVAVAVHPDDERHRAALGRRVRVPLTDRVVPIIADTAIDPKFGNGALKVTPRHDPIDHDLAQRHSELRAAVEIFDESARLTGDWVPERFRGLDRVKARAAVTESLQADGFVVKHESYTHSVGHSERTDAVVEPRLSTQWFVRMGPLAAPVVAAVQEGTIRVHPDRWQLTFFRWMEGLQDWCISRQVVWGHPIPVYYCDACGEVLAALAPPDRCPKCRSEPLRADPDVLDTWFTSWLWPFVILGWPEATDDLARFYPTSVLETGRDIMFFWVARMMMAGYHFTGKPPFTDVYFHGMLRDEQGRRMSKHLGNSPDPLEVVQQHGADAMRFSLLYPNPVEQDGGFGVGTLEGARNFLTKLWNVVRFARQQLPEGTEPPNEAPPTGELSVVDRWILSRWSRLADDLDAALDGFEFTRAATLLYQFVWHDLADRYVEAAKESLQGRRGAPAARASRATLLFVIERTLRQLHPIVPHVTEELWHAIPHEGESLAITSWPSGQEVPRDPESEVAMETVFDAIRALRNLRSENRIPPADRPEAAALPASPVVSELLAAHSTTIVQLARLGGLTLLQPESARPAHAASRVLPTGEFFVTLPASGAAETESLTREHAMLAELLGKTRARLEDPTFRQRAPPEVVQAAEEKARELAGRLERIAANLAGDEGTKASS
ncbi:MAG: valine--tRNA ligase [Thermoplasmata archaeon]|nr:valine--tRNA ligase [Thermoplasmata archaeon]